MDLSYTVGWPIAKAAFAHVMTRVEQGKISWNDSNAIWQSEWMVNTMPTWVNTGLHKLSLSRPTVYNTDRTGTVVADRAGPCMPGAIKKFTCNNFNAGYCRVL